MAEALASITPLTEDTCKVTFLNYDAPLTTDITSITFNDVSYNVVDSGRKRNRWCVVEASYSELGGESRATVIYSGGERPGGDGNIVTFGGKTMSTFGGNDITLMT